VLECAPFSGRYDAFRSHRGRPSDSQRPDPIEEYIVLISQAWAQAAGGAPGGMDLLGMLPIALMFVVLYFFMIRPQAKRAKEHKALLAGLAKGDEVVAGGGMLGKVTKVTENYVTIEIASNVEVQVQKPSIQLVLPKGTLRNAT
jgi:preprotein translocase subunit YajC